ncbi:DsbA family protein, partial [Acinetobacter baumannii]
SEKGLIKSSGDISKATVTIVEFADFLCPHCKSAATSLDAFINNNPNAKLVFKTFPLDGKCNKGMQHQGDGVRCQLAAAPVCADQMNQSGWK